MSDIFSASPSPIKLPTFEQLHNSQPLPKQHTPGRALTREEKKEARRRGDKESAVSSCITSYVSLMLSATGMAFSYPSRDLTSSHNPLQVLQSPSPSAPASLVPQPSPQRYSQQTGKNVTPVTHLAFKPLPSPLPASRRQPSKLIQSVTLRSQHRTPACQSDPKRSQPLRPSPLP